MTDNAALLDHRLNIGPVVNLPGWHTRNHAITRLRFPIALLELASGKRRTTGHEQDGRQPNAQFHIHHNVHLLWFLLTHTLGLGLKYLKSIEAGDYIVCNDTGTQAKPALEIEVESHVRAVITVLDGFILFRVLDVEIGVEIIHAEDQAEVLGQPIPGVQVSFHDEPVDVVNFTPNERDP